MNLAALIRSRLAALTISQAELARRAGRSQGFISRLLDGDYADFSTETVDDLADALGVPYDVVMIAIRADRAARNIHPTAPAGITSAGASC